MNFLDKMKVRPTQSTVKQPSVKINNVDIVKKDIIKDVVPEYILRGDDISIGSDGDYMNIEDDKKRSTKIVNPRTKKILKNKFTDINVSNISNKDWVKLNNKNIETRVLSTSTNRTNIPVSAYYMYNRERFIHFINELFNKYRTDFEDENKKKISCDDIGKTKGAFSLLPHQNIIKD